MLLRLVTGNGEAETGVRERVYSGNPPWRTKEKKRKQFGEMRGSVTDVNVSIYGLRAQMTSTFLLEQSPIGTGINKE